MPDDFDDILSLEDLDTKEDIDFREVMSLEKNSTDREEDFAGIDKEIIQQESAKILEHISSNDGTSDALEIQQKLNFLLYAGVSNSGEIMQKILEHLDSILIEYQKPLLNATDRDVLDDKRTKIDTLYKLLHVQKTEEGVSKCTAAIQSLEVQLLKELDGKIPAIIDEDIALLESIDGLEVFTQPQGEHVARFMEKILALNPDMKDKFTSNDGNYGFTNVDEGGESSFWNVKFAAGSQYLSIMNSLNPEVFLPLQPKEFIEAVENNTLSDLVEKANANFKSEKSGEQELDTFDLPKDRKIVYVRMISKQYDSTMSHGMLGATLFGAALEHQHGKQLVTEPIQFTDDPNDVIKNMVQKYEALGEPIHFVFNIMSHGDSNGFMFNEKFAGEDMIDRTKEANDNLSFTYTSEACFGGSAMQKLSDSTASLDPNVAKKLSVFLQTKSNVLNLGAVGNKEKGQSVHAAPSSLYMMKHLFEDDTYGKSFRKADTNSKKKIALDPEAFINGKYIAHNISSQSSHSSLS